MRGSKISSVEHASVEHDYSRVPDGALALACPLTFSCADLDPEIDPHHDLDGYVNARWRALNPVPADRSCWDTFTALSEATLRTQAELARAAVLSQHPDAAQRVVAALWRAGMDAPVRELAGLHPLDDDFARIDACHATTDIVALLEDWHARGDVLLYALDVSPDFLQPSQPLLYIRPARLPLARSDYADTARLAMRRRRLCVAYFAGLLRRCGRVQADAMAQARAAFDIDRALSSMLPSAPERDVMADYRLLGWEDAQAVLAPLSLQRGFVESQVSPPPRISIAAPDFHVGLALLLHERPVSHWRSWLYVRLLDLAAPDLDADMRRRHARFHGQGLRGLRCAAPLWKQVLSAIDRDASHAMAELYVRGLDVSAMRWPIRAIFERLREAMRGRLACAAWLGEAARAQSLAKIERMRADLVAPAEWPDWSQCATIAASYRLLLREVRTHAQRRLLKKLDAAGPGIWSMPAHHVNARYDPHRNRITVPAAILQPPFFAPDADHAANYGGIGAVMAHEMSHGFDDQGRRFDADGRLGAGWAVGDSEAFAGRAERVRACFDGLRHRGGSVDGLRTLGENIADLTGLAVAWDALTADTGSRFGGDAGAEAECARRFFIAWAVLWRQNLTPEEAILRNISDPHAPCTLRVNLPARSLPAFHIAFAAPPGAAMSPTPSVW